MHRSQHETIERFGSARRKDRDDVVSSVYLGRAYALNVTTVELASTAARDAAMTCYTPPTSQKGTRKRCHDLLRSTLTTDSAQVAAPISIGDIFAS
jgi:hypothetical protein